MPMSALGAAAGVPTPAIDAVITLVRAMTGKDFSQRGAHAWNAWALRGMNASQIARFVELGNA